MTKKTRNRHNFSCRFCHVSSWCIERSESPCYTLLHPCSTLLSNVEAPSFSAALVVILSGFDQKIAESTQLDVPFLPSIELTDRETEITSIQQRSQTSSDSKPQSAFRSNLGYFHRKSSKSGSTRSSLVERMCGNALSRCFDPQKGPGSPSVTSVARQRLNRPKVSHLLFSTLEAQYHLVGCVW